MYGNKKGKAYKPAHYLNMESMSQAGGMACNKKGQVMSGGHPVTGSNAPMKSTPAKGPKKIGL